MLCVATLLAPQLSKQEMTHKLVPISSFPIEAGLVPGH